MAHLHVLSLCLALLEESYRKLLNILVRGLELLVFYPKLDVINLYTILNVSGLIIRTTHREHFFLGLEKKTESSNVQLEWLPWVILGPPVCLGRWFLIGLGWDLILYPWCLLMEPAKPQKLVFFFF